MKSWGAEMEVEDRYWWFVCNGLMLESMAVPFSSADSQGLFRAS